jgi:hypothetical protein
MLTVIWGIGGFHVVNMTRLGRCLNAEYFLTHALDPLLATVFAEGRKGYALQLSIYLENCRPHFSNTSKQYFDENSLTTVPHPPCSPDLASSDFWLFGHIKTSFAGNVFNDIDELLEVVIELSN